MRKLLLAGFLLLPSLAFGQVPTGMAPPSSVPINGGTPSIASGACGATSNGVISGTDQTGKITIGAAATATCAVLFSTTLPTVPRSVVLTPANAAAAALAAGAPFVSALAATGFTFQAAALASTTWYYLAY